MDYDPENPLPSLERQAFEKHFSVEAESMAAEGYAESKEAILRKVALRVILENSKTFNFDSFIPYLAMNYFDRFISRHQLPNVIGRVRDDIVLAAISCLTLAWKMRDQTFRFRFFLADKNLKEDYKNHILAMELHIVNGLNWRMRAVTAICFVLFFSEKITVGSSIKRRTLNEIIIQSQGDISFTKFKPSVIAASALLAACRLVHCNEYDKCKMELLTGGYINEEDLEPCLQKTYGLCIEKQIQIERNEKFNSGCHPRVKSEETSSSISIKKPTQAISEIEEETESQPETSSISRRSGKEPMEIFAMLTDSESKVDPSLTSRRPGKEPVPTLSEIMVQRDESENETGLSFDLKWRLWSSDNPEELTIDSPIFRPQGPASDPTVSDPSGGTTSRDDSALFAPCSFCHIM